MVKLKIIIICIVVLVIILFVIINIIYIIINKFEKNIIAIRKNSNKITPRSDTTTLHKLGFDRGARPK